LDKNVLANNLMGGYNANFGLGQKLIQEDHYWLTKTYPGVRNQFSKI